MDESLLEVRHYEGEGYRPLVNFGTWRVAILRWEPSMQADKLARMERHTQTDEVFVLLQGQASLILGGKSSRVDDLTATKLEASNLYNVRQNVWHAILLSREATILIVEDRDTGENNTEYCELPDKLKKEIIEFEVGFR